MKKTDLVEAMATKLGTTKRAAEEAVEALVEILKAGLETEGSASLPSFGVFTKKTRTARVARNPKTGQSVMVGARTTVGFRPASCLKSKE